MATFKVTLTFIGISGNTPLGAAKKIRKWITVDPDMIYDVINEETGESFTVDLSDDDENAVLPNKQN